MTIATKTIKKTVNIRKFFLKDLIKGDFPLRILEHKEYARDHILHDHDFTELVIVERGKAIHFLSNFRQTIASGDVLVIPKGIKHGYTHSEDFKIINIIFDLSLLDPPLGMFKQSPGFQALFNSKPLRSKSFLTLEPEQIDYARQLTFRMICELREKEIGYQNVCVLILADLVIFLSRLSSKNKLSMHINKLAKVISYMEENYTRHISLTQLSNIAKLSPRNFQRIFKDNFGISPYGQLIKFRLQHAGNLLRNTDLSISEVAYNCGFADNAYFARQFKKFFSLSPSKYRKEAKKGTN
jgi:AraC family L-rhamnose operon regulatory protein RhaS